MRWPVKCFIDSCKGVIPFQNQIRDVKYRFAEYVSDAWNDEWTIRQGLSQIEGIRALAPVENVNVLEVGSGWQPLIPALYSLAGASSVSLTDLRRLCQPASFASAIKALRTHKEIIVERLGTREQDFDEAVQWKPGDSLEEGLRRLRLTYLAPCDCRSLDLPSSTFNIVTSRAVLEHIPPDVVQGIFDESFRLLKPGALACHIVDNSDHWQHSDNQISRVNFLRFSDNVFRWTYLNGLNYQNRLRHPEYGEMLGKSGFTILRNESEVDRNSVTALKTMQIDPRFRHFTAEDLAAVNTFLLARKD